MAWYGADIGRKPEVLHVRTRLTLCSVPRLYCHISGPYNQPHGKGFAPLDTRLKFRVQT